MTAPPSDKGRLRFLVATLVVVGSAGLVRWSNVLDRPLPDFSAPPATSTPHEVATAPPGPIATIAADPRAREKMTIATRLQRTSDVDFELARLRGWPFAVYFWDAGVPASLDGLPFVTALHRRYVPGTSFIGIPLSYDYGTIARIAEEYALGWNQYTTPSDNQRWLDEMKRRAGRELKAGDLVILDREGNVAYAGTPSDSAWAALNAVATEPPGPWGPDPPLREVQGKILYAGGAFPPASTGRMHLIVFDKRKPGDGLRIPDASVEFDATDSTFRIPALAPGSKAAIVFVELDGIEGGRFRGVDEFGVPDNPSDRRVIFTVKRYLHLREPFDNAWPAPRAETPAFYASPVLFSWDAMPEADRYHWKVRDRDSGRVEAGDTDATQVSVELPPGKTFDFSLVARQEGKSIANFEIQREDAISPTYTFRTASRP